MVKKCSSCGKEVKFKFSEFKCPSCGKEIVIRCDSCRSLATKFSCRQCGFTGP